MNRFRIPTLLLAPLLLAPVAFAAPQGEPQLKSGDLKKLTKPMSEWLEAAASGDFEGAAEARESMQEAIDKLQKKVKDKDFLSLVDDWALVLELGRDYSTSGYRKGRVEKRGEDEGIPHYLRLPKSYKPGKEGLPVIYLIGEPGEDPTDAIEGLPSDVTDNAIVVAADLSGIAAADALGEEGRPRLIRPFGVTSQFLHIDRNRILLLGTGAGADVAARFAALVPHFFSAVALVGGKSEAGKATANLATLEVGTPADASAAATWLMEQAPRDPYPLDFTVNLTEPWAGRFYWVQVMSFDPTTIDGEGDPSTLSVKVDRSSNTISLDGKGVYKVDLFLNDNIIDLDKPVILMRNGVEYKFQAYRSLPTLLENFALNLDARSVFPAMVRRVELPKMEDPGSDGSK